MHHPPAEVGIEWMNTDPGEAWVEHGPQDHEDEEKKE